MEVRRQEDCEGRGFDKDGSSRNEDDVEVVRGNKDAEEEEEDDDEDAEPINENADNPRAEYKVELDATMDVDDERCVSANGGCGNGGDKSPRSLPDCSVSPSAPFR